MTSYKIERKNHIVVSIISTLCIATFFASTVIVELFGTKEAIATVKSLILLPGLFILIPAIAATGGSGFVLLKSRKGRLVDNKKKRMQSDRPKLTLFDHGCKALSVSQNIRG